MLQTSCAIENKYGILDPTPRILPSFDQPHLLVLCLASSTPLWRHIDAILLLLVSLLLCLVHRCRLVFSRRIDSVQDQWIGTSVDELVLRPCRDYDQVACLDILVLSCNRRLSSARGKGQNLINGVFLTNWLVERGQDMHNRWNYFVSDVTTDWNGHKHQLRV
jgi:hypothetical protein